MEIHQQIQLIRDTISCLQNDPVILASEEDAHFFREILKQKFSEKVLKTPVLQTASITIPTKEPFPKVEKILPQEIPKPIPNQNTNVTIAHHSPIDFRSLKALFQKLFPNIAIINEVPDDYIAKKIARRWQTTNLAAPISILSLNESASQKKILMEITKALDVYFGPAKLVDAEKIEKEKQWEAFLSSPEVHWIITCDYTLWQLTELMRFYKESKEKKTRFLGKIPLLLLPDLSLYLKDPLLKRSLWKALCQKLSL